MSPPSSELHAHNCVLRGHIILAHENGLIVIKKSSCEPRARAKGRPAHWHLEGGGSGDRANTSPMSLPVCRPSAAAAMGMTMMGRAGGTPPCPCSVSLRVTTLSPESSAAPFCPCLRRAGRNGSRFLRCRARFPPRGTSLASPHLPRLTTVSDIFQKQCAALSPLFSLILPLAPLPCSARPLSHLHFRRSANIMAPFLFPRKRD